MTALDSQPGRTGKLGEVFRIAFPLIMSNGTFAFKLFCDRMMVAWYSDRSIAASITAGMVSFTMVSLFMGIANYGNAFVAQYSGAERHDRTGLAVWQSMLFSLAAGLFIIIAGSFAAPLFYSFGHERELALEEEAYFLTLVSGAVFALLNSAIMCFWTGRNKTWIVVGVGFGSIFLNVGFNWALIFGADGSPHMAGGPLAGVGAALNWFSALVGAPTLGIVGAGIATVGTDALSFLAFLVLFLLGRNRREFGTYPARVFSPQLMRRMLRFGFGNGMQLMLDIGSFAIFNVLMGKYGIVVGAAAAVAISVNGAAFIPMMGIGAAASIMVGHGIGAQDTGYAVRAVRGARILIMSYMGFMCILFEIYPQFLVSLFAPGETMDPETRRLAIIFLRYAGAFCIADGFFILYGNAIRGAGDTRFSMYVMGFCGWFLFAIPCLIAFWAGMDPFFLWKIIVFYAFSSAAIFYLRFRQGKWKHMKVIEETGSTRVSARRTGASSVRLSAPVISDNAVITLPAGESGEPAEEDPEEEKP